MTGEPPADREAGTHVPRGRSNRLANASSPYLIQHAGDPVDWHEWEQQAFQKARREDKPIFLSIGYSSCHWCHVMQRESFADEEVARILNDNFVSIKVDREERPDVDETYMTATQLVTGGGGWPNSLWLNHEKKPWFAGTYWPKEDTAGRRGFKALLHQLAEIWNDRRDEVEKQADHLWNALEKASRLSEGTRAPDREVVDGALRALRDAFDVNFGGFGGAPKFPPHSALRLLLAQYTSAGDDALLSMASKTLDALCRGGIRDHIGGGFHRYSTDARWQLPHFEKMLSDNAQLIRTFTDGYLLTGRAHYRHVALEICRWVMEEMIDAGGGFYTAVDADSQGHEGWYYTWQWEEIMGLLGEEEGALFAHVYGMEPSGNFRDESTGRKTGRNVPYLRIIPKSAADELALHPQELRERLTRATSILRQARAKRPRPRTDDKILSAWNGLMIGGMAYAGRRLDDRQCVDAARRAAEFVMASMTTGKRLHRSWREGQLSGEGYLEDYAFLAEGLLELHAATGEQRWLDLTRELVDVIFECFHDPSEGGFFFTALDSTDAPLPYKDAFDKQTPSSSGTTALVLIRLWELTGDRRSLEEAGTVLKSEGGIISSAPRAVETLVLAVARYLDCIEGADKRVARGNRPEARHRSRPVTVDLYADSLQVAPGDKVNFAVKLEIDDGWHVNSNAPLSSDLTPTAVTPEQSDVAVLQDISYPQGEVTTTGSSDGPHSGEQQNPHVSIYRDTVWVKGALRIARRAPSGQFDMRFEVCWQACGGNRCLPRETAMLTVPMEVSPDAPRARRHPEIFG